MSNPKVSWVSGVLGLALLVAGLGWKMASPGEPRAKIDYGKWAEGAQWEWVEAKASPIWSASRMGDKYGVVLANSPKNRFAWTVRITEGERTAFEWSGHARSVFRVVGDRLYYADFHPGASGGQVGAVDLKTGREVWKSPLAGIGPIRHSAYSNSIILDADEDGVWVYGNESMGRYIEAKDPATGKTIGHRVFKDEKPTK